MNAKAERQRNALRSAIRESGKTLNAVSGQAGVTEGTIRAFLKGKTQSLRYETLKKIAAVTNRPVTYLLGETDTFEAAPVAVPSADLTVMRSGPIDVPIFRVALSPNGQWGEVIMEEGIIGHTQRPVAARENSLLFAFAVPDDSMALTFHAGDLILVDPTRQPGHERPAVVELHSQDGARHFVIGFLMLRRPERIEIRQTSPDRVLSIEMEKVKGIYRILFGQDYLAN